MPDLVDPTSAIKSVQKEIVQDQLRWKSLAIGVANGDPTPPAKIIQRLGQAWDFDAETSTAIFLEDCQTLKKHRSLLSQERKAETALKDWRKEYESPEVLKAELLEVEQRSVEIRTQLSRHWQKDQGVSRTHWKIKRIENDNPRVFS